jgi:hypothetical protein
MAWRSACDARSAQRRRWQAEVFALNNLLVCLLLYLTLRCAGCCGTGPVLLWCGTGPVQSFLGRVREPRRRTHGPRWSGPVCLFVCMFVCLYVCLRSESAALCLC